MQIHPTHKPYPTPSNAAEWGHQFNNILTTILGNLEYTLEELPPDAPQRPYILSAFHAAERGAQLTSLLLQRPPMLTKEGATR